MEPTCTPPATRGSAAAGSPGTGQMVVDAPPALPRRAPVNPLTRVFPIVLVVAMAGMIAVYVSSGAMATRGPTAMMFPIMMALSAIGTVVFGLRGGGGATELHRDRCAYLRYLDGVDTVAAETARSQWLQAHAAHPDPRRLWTLAAAERIWDRRPDAPDFCEVRIGVGQQPLWTRLVVAQGNWHEDNWHEDTVGQETDPVTASALGQLLRRRSMVDDAPVTVNLRELGHLAVAGAVDASRALLRAVICQLATAHSPQHVRIAAVLDAAVVEHWDWLKWLAHQWSSVPDGQPVPLRVRRLTELPCADPAVHTVVIVDSVTAGVANPGPGGPLTLLTVAATTETGTADLHLDLDAEVPRCGDTPVRVDQLTLTEALTCARRLARHRAAPVPDTSGWPALIGVDDVERMEPPVHPPPLQRFLRVPIGRTLDGSAVHLDLKEAAHDGMGPHGLCVGATGSGKSEFLRTLVLGLIATHPPEVLNLVLVDFKGGATFLGLNRTRHVSALITNLSEEALLVARMADALAGEMTRRQELLRTAGNLANLDEYRRRTDLPGLPALLIVVDEFSELLQHHPDFAELFVAIGRLGRSLGIHLLLASQRLDEGRLRGLDSHLSYRVCLKTFSPSESRSVLGISDAYELPNTPGAAYLKTPSGEIVKFQTAFASAPHTLGQPAFRAKDSDDPAPRRFSLSWTASTRPSPPAATTTVLQRVVDRLSGHGTPAHQVWLPPLPAAIPLSDVLFTDHEPLTVAIGLIDRPFEQRRDRLLLELAAGQGNVAVVGGPQSGKSTAAMTVALALAASHAPRDVQIYGLDFGSGALGGLQALPHVGAVAGRGDPDLVRRTIAELQTLLRAREDRFTALGISSMAEYRARRATGEVGDPFGDVFLIIDGWSSFRGEFDSLEPAITALAVQGLSLGVHIVVTASRWADFRPALKDQLGTRIELRLGDPAESEIDRKRARELGLGRPGTGLTREGRELLVALPRLDGTPSTTGITAALNRVADTLSAQHGGDLAPRIRLLPPRVCSDELPPVPRRRATEVLLGLGERELAPVLVDFAAHPDLVILGDTGCGKSTALRALCADLVATNDPSDVQLLIVDFRRALLGAVESEHLAGYAASPGALEAALPPVLDILRSRMPGPDVTQRALRDRSWWTGPEFYVVVDDYDLVATAGANPLSPLSNVLPYARDLGVHLVVARRSGGAARAMFDPVLAAVKDLGGMGLVMSASPDEGVLWGSVRPVRLPPGRGTLITRGAPDQLVQVAIPGPDESW
ncbi:type VII secretion protein EccC [Mycobacterium sp. NS-7484]|uniref:type VII secretion protein EccCb n=1 Tax=Mycobacterium sp. NS-7484 TaxID=1834161 RepID=UPI00096D0DCD|nr:type VII secretion protein EccCb [Mycobacterium sp. NS-7484]OMC00093.1 type VII secretion protein EccC [Mycobacterium sp. NS-7484]